MENKEIDGYELMEKVFKSINEKIASGNWFELSDDDVKTLFKVVKIYELARPIVVEMKGLNKVRIISEEEYNAKLAKWGVED